jgi:peptidyl-dipeptidase Dcp
VCDHAGAPVGLVLHDNFARPGKRSGAWSSRFRDQEDLDAPVRPIIVNNNNFSRGEPTLLSFDDARTLFHEFGHGLHGLSSRVRYRSQSGTALRRDFVEFPSQIFEHWLSAPENLRRHARHYLTGAAMPDDLLRRLGAARPFGQSFATVEYLAAALFDLELHRDPAPETLDIDRCEQAFCERFGVPREIGLRHRPAHFQHLFAGDGYAAGYYAYLWAEVLEADGFAAFTEQGDVFDPDWRRGSKRSTAPGTPATRWISIAAFAAASRGSRRCWRSAASPPAPAGISETFRPPGPVRLRPPASFDHASTIWRRRSTARLPRGARRDSRCRAQKGPGDR